MAECIAVVGDITRDDALTRRFADERAGYQVVGIGADANPGIIDVAQRSGGSYHRIAAMAGTPEIFAGIGDIVAETRPDMLITNSSQMLEGGIVDYLQKRFGSSLLLPCPNRAASRIEWDKFALRELIKEINPTYNPKYETVTEPNQIKGAINRFAYPEHGERMPVVIKPRGLTGGNGVKVMGRHFSAYEEAEAYARQVFAMPGQEGLEVQERLDGPEFTLQVFTDGRTMIRPPATYDYPYRKDGDIGPGTGGVGTFSMQDGLLPFLTQEDYDEAFSFSEQLLRKWQETSGQPFKGVWYSSFFKTPTGLKMTEINARGGDPELINIVDLLQDDVDLGNAFAAIATGELRPDAVRFQKLASTVIHLMPPEYGYRAGALDLEFTMDKAAIEEAGCRVRFSAAERVDDSGTYAVRQVAKALGVSAIAATPWEARERIHDTFVRHFGQPLPLDYRREIGDRRYIQSLVAR